MHVLVQLGAGRLSSATWHEVRSSWQDCVAALAPADLAPFLHDAARALYRLLHTYVLPLYCHCRATFGTDPWRGT